MKGLKEEIRKYITERLLAYAIRVCPEGAFKIELMRFYVEQIFKMDKMENKSKSEEHNPRHLLFDVAGTGKIQISKGCRWRTARVHGFSFGVSWGIYGYCGGVLDREEAKRLAEHILAEDEKITPEMKAEEQRYLIERDESLKKAGFIS